MIRTIALLTAALACLATAQASDLPTHKPAPPNQEVRTWGAIAYSPSSGEVGIFWGADEAEEAQGLARDHCRNASADQTANCKVATVFWTPRHRHWDVADQGEYIGPHCGALAVGAASAIFAAASGDTRRAAEDAALEKCSRGAQSCQIKTWQCT